MTTYLERYQSGEYEQVWSELNALGEQVRQEKLLPDALAVARETMRRVKCNAEVIAARLQSIGYRFGYEADEEEDNFVSPCSPPSPDAAEQVAELEKLVGLLPLSLRAWYEVGGGVDFIGYHKLWPGIYLDPLVIGPIEYALGECQDWQDQVSEDGLDEVGPYEVDVAPDFYHKANESGGGPYQIELPNAAADALLLYEWHDTHFVEYLRECFRWGGFPGFDISHPMNPNHLNADAVMPPEHFALLTVDLLPI